MSKEAKEVRTWIEIDKKALAHNVAQFLKLIPKKTRLMAVIKSNAYGHGLILTAKVLLALRSFSEGGWFGVDSIVEAMRMRREGIKNPILVLGSTLPARMKEAAEQNITLTVSNSESLNSLMRTNKRIAFHLKVDTGMYRQGFLPAEIFKLLNFLKRHKIFPQGIYTHFASKDLGFPIYTKLQLSEFKKVLADFEKAGFKNLIRHAAASNATILFPESHFDMVRIGMGLYGYWPSLIAKVDHSPVTSLQPVLNWKTVVGEIKEIPGGSYLGYDLIEQVKRKTKIAVLPVGYWHGYGRALSSIGEVLIRGRRAKVLGRVSMDMIVVDVTDTPKVRVGDEVVLIGRQGREEIWADELALKASTSEYEFLTRINPLIRRVTK